MEFRLGELLIEGGVLNREQVEKILEAQQHSGEPFGLLAEHLYGVDPAAVEAAWARQYASITRTIDPDTEPYDEAALALVTRRQVWQFRVLPIRFEPVELMIATTQMHLRRALRFATNVIGMPVFFVMSDPEALGRAMCRRYPLAGMTPRSIMDDGMDRILAGAPGSASRNRRG